MANKILSNEELKALLAIHTTVKEAKLIRKRNKALLAAFMDAELDGFVNIGCPHCRFYDCDNCRYNKVLDAGSKREMRCCRMTFGGYSFFDEREGVKIEEIITLTYDYAAVEVHAVDLKEDVSNKVITWLEGHIEWADKVIESGENDENQDD
jgi:hypothetical protein